MPIYPYTKKGKEHWYFAFEVKDHNGKRKTIKQRGFTGKTAARNAEREARVAWEKGDYIDPSKTTFGEYMKEWLENKQNMTEHTRYTNVSYFNNHIMPTLGHIPLQKVNVAHIEKFIKSLRDKGLSDGTVKKIYALSRTAMKAAATKEMITKDPFTLLDDSDKPYVKHQNINYWTKEEVKKFLSSFEHRYKIAFTLAIYTGMRQGEILGLKWDEVDFDNNQIRVRNTLTFKKKLKDGAKSSSGNRSISVSDFVMKELRKHKALMAQEGLINAKTKSKDKLVIHSTNGNPVDSSTLRVLFKRICDENKIRKIRFHDLRHTCASLLLQAGVHPKVVQEMLGHSSIKITLDTYSHLLPNMQNDAAKTLEQMLK